MPKFELNRATGQMQIKQPERISRSELMQKSHRVHFMTIHEHKIDDADIMAMMEKVMSGTRNVNYLVTPENRKYMTGLAYTMLRSIDF